jgi:hypothetical protein
MTDRDVKSTESFEREAARASLNAFARSSAALVDISADQSAAASLAYLRAKEQGLDKDEAARLMVQALVQSERMRESGLDAEYRFELKRGFWWDVGVGLIPAGLLALVLWVVLELRQSPVTLSYVAGGALALLSVAAYVGYEVRQTNPSGFLANALKRVAHGDVSPLGGSVGALVVGAFLFATGGLALVQFTQEKQRQHAVRLSAELGRIDAALAVTLAGRSVDAELKSVSEFVENTTGLDWNIAKVERIGDQVIARARLQDGEALVRQVRQSPSGGGFLQTELRFETKSQEVRRYLYGTVVASDDKRTVSARQVVLRLKDSDLIAAYELPPNAIAPAPGTVVLAREQSSGVLATIQSLDDVRQSLLRSAAIARVGASAPGD